MPPVFIKPARRADAAELIHANCESRAYHEPWVQPFTDAEGFEDWIGRQFTGADVGLVARDVASHGIVGVVSFSQISRGSFLNAYLGYYGMVRFARQGLMTQAVHAAVRYAFEEIRLHRLEANIQPANLSSINLVRRIGFHLEGFSQRYLRIGGIWCDHERWALLSDDPAIESDRPQPPNLSF